MLLDLTVAFLLALLGVSNIARVWTDPWYFMAVDALVGALLLFISYRLCERPTKQKPVTGA